MATTAMAGPDDAMAAEQEYLQVLSTVTSYTSDGSALDMFADDTKVLRYGPNQS